MKLISSIYRSLFAWLRMRHYAVISTRGYSGSKPLQNQPVVYSGKGKIYFDGECVIGWRESPAFYSTYCYIEAREEDSEIRFGEGCHFNNNIKIIAGRGIISIGKNCMIGLNCSIMNSDFHNVEPGRRNESPFPYQDIFIGDNVFLGNNVEVLKGAIIGSNTTIGAGSVVLGEVPANCVAAGVPARVLKSI